MMRTVLCGAVFALSLGGLAAAQSQAGPRGADPGAGAAPSPAAPAADAAQGLKPGMTVKDSTGATIGTINRIGHTSDGTPAAELNVDGKAVPMVLAALSLAPEGDHAVIALTKAQIQAAARQAPG